MFTRDQIEEIKKKLIMLGTKDTQFPDTHKLNGEEIVAIVQDGENKKIPLSSIINDDFINVSKDTTEILTLSTAVSKIDINNRKLGQIITFKDSANSWAIRQFTGSSLDNWNDISLWKSISGIDELKSQADTNTSNISSLNTEVSAMQSKVDENTTSISQINNNIADNNKSIAQINTTLDEHTESINARITTDRIADGAVTTEKIATSAFDSTLSVSGKIAPADIVGTKLNELESKTSLSVNDFLASGFISQTAAGIYYDPNVGVNIDNLYWNGFLVYLRPGIKSFLVKGGIYHYAHYFNDYPNIKDKALGKATIASPNADGLVEISVSSNDNGCYILVTMNIDKQKVSDASVISTEMYLMKKSFIDAGITDMPLLKQSLNDKIGGYEEQINGRWNSRGAILIDGTIITGSGYETWSYTDPIPVNRGDIIIVNCAGGIKNISAIASSDANGENIKNIKSTIRNQVVYYFVNDEEYIRCTTRFEMGGYARIYKGGVISEEIVLVDTIKKAVIGESLIQEYNLLVGQRLQKYLTVNKLGKWKFKLNSDSTEITNYEIWAQDSSGGNIGFITCNVGVEYEYDLPVGTARVMFFKTVNVSIETSFTLHYTIPSDLQAELNEIHNSLNKSSKTDGIVEPGSELTQDNVNLLSERSHKLNVTNTNVPVVAFIFDDSYVQSYVDLFNERGLKLTFAIIGNVNKSEWETTGNAIRKQVLNGHGTCAHGVVRGVSVTGTGVDTMNDADVKIATEGENKAFDDYKLSHRGFVQYNTWKDNPHTWALMGRYYDYIVGFDDKKCINAPSTTDLYQLRRMWTDNPNMLDAQKASVDAAIAHGDCLLIFGGHFARTGQGGTYSTMEEFVALLDYVAEKVSAGQMLSLNMDDAVDMLWGRAIAHNVVMASNYSYRNPMANSIKIENGLKICTNIGTKAIYSMRITGTTVAGAFTINLGNASKTTNASSCQSVTINTTAGESITSVISKIVSSIYKAYTVRSFNDGEVFLYRDINGVTFTPYITNNTSELVFDIVQITEGTEAVWE